MVQSSGPCLTQYLFILLPLYMLRNLGFQILSLTQITYGSKMCKYIQTHFTLCNCKYWSLKLKCNKATRRGIECGLYPYPKDKEPDVMKIEKCEFCWEAFRERLKGLLEGT
jgi:hypothetical protein